MTRQAETRMGFDLFSKLRPALIGKMTQRAVLEALRAGGPMSRANLTRSTGISPTTVSNAVGALLRAKLIEEGDAGPPALGRPGKKLRLATVGSQVLGAVLDAHQCHIVAAAVDGRLKDSFTFPTPKTYEGILDELVAHAQRLQRRGVRTLGLGLSLPGLVHRSEGKAVFSPNLHQTDGRYPAADLKQRLKLPVYIMHETDALCLGERSYGAARGIEDYVVLDCVEGLGVGAVIKGQLLEGHTGFAGELGHVAVDPEHGPRCGCGNRGCLETLATDAALTHRLSERLGRELTMDDALAMVGAADPDATAVARDTLDAMSIGLATVINLFNPAAVFVHARVLDAEEGLLERLVFLMRRRALAPAVNECKVYRARSTKLQGAVAGFTEFLFDALGPRLRAIEAAS
jgi:N-acetylglucosamine repressor